jgi:hypothetical protein
MATKKQRTHNEWFRPIARKAKCSTCNHVIDKDDCLWSWGEYVNAKWRTVKHFCQHCFVEQVQTPLVEHTNGCGCEVTICFKGINHNNIPDWLTLPEFTGCEKKVS